MPLKITRETVEHIAGLAKLQFAEEDMDTLVHQFRSIVAYVDRLSEIDVDEDGAAERPRVGPEHLREDRAEAGPERQESLRNAPDLQGSLFAVPRVVDKGDERGSS
jgi:aspartyl-tRNA(Asn)/glutamyl-tRNA(Gln) amidotransferase subunit C